jgi:serine protease AprX
MPLFKSNYPASEYGKITLLPTPERVGARADFTGRGVTIAFIDSGFYAHPDLAGRIVTHVDATTDDICETDSVTKSPAFSWHGQMTTVIGAGDGRRSGGRFRGIASAARLVLVKIADPLNRVKEADIERGLKWVLRHHHRYNIRVVNLSVGGDYVSYDSYHPLHRLVRELTDAGLVIVAAAGNSGQNHLVPPASAADAITVGGLDDNNTTDEHEWTLYNHNFGMGYDGSVKPDLIAPARWIASPILPGTRVANEAFWLGALMLHNREHPITRLLFDGRADLSLSKLFGERFHEGLYDTLQQRIYAHKIIDAYYQHVDGTSVAAPIVTAVCAQMLEANPTLEPRAVRQILQRTARRIDRFADDRQGCGVMNAAAAVDEALRLAPSLDGQRPVS